MNNNFNQDFVTGSAAAAQEVHDEMEMCREMDVYPAGMIIQSEEEKKPNNDVSLHDINASNDDDDDDDMVKPEKKVLLDLNQYMEEPLVSSQLPDDSFGGEFAQGFSDNWELDCNQKQDFYNYNGQESMIVNRMEIDPVQYENQNIFSPYSDASYSSELLSVNTMDSDPPSPMSTITSFSTDEPINNNRNDRRATRSRKMSARDGKVAIKADTPYRSRRTKAQMEEMSEKEKVELKQEQNRLNAKKSVAKKNEIKAEFMAEIPKLSEELESLQEKNAAQKNNLRTVYRKNVFPAYDNNSPYGLPGEFNNTLDAASIPPVIQDGGLLQKLEMEHDEAQRKVDDLKTNKYGVKENTYASQKSRAKKALDLATGKFRTTKLRMEIAQQEMVWNELANAAKTLNQYLREIGLEMLPEYQFHVDITQFEPS